MKKYVVILAWLLVPLLLFSQDRVTAESQHDSAIALSTIIAIIVSGLSGGLAGAFVSIKYSQIKSKNTYKALLTVYCVEFVNAFSSCITYYKQAVVEDNISYSTIFNFSDVSFLSRFTEVCKDMSLINAIVVLKAYYFQVARHIEKVSHVVVEAEAFQNNVERSRDCMAIAVNHRKAAIGLFNSCYNDVVGYMNQLLDAADKSGIDLGHLRSEFDKLKCEKTKIIDAMLAADQQQP